MANKKLGHRQLGVLQSLVRHQCWYGDGWGCGWNYGTANETKGILDKLVAYGLVTTAEEKTGYSDRTSTVYRPTEPGIAIATAWTQLIVGIKEETHDVH